VGITVNGSMVGRFVPANNGINEVNGTGASSAGQSAAVTEAVEFIERFGSEHTLAGLGWKALRDEGRGDEGRR